MEIEYKRWRGFTAMDRFDVWLCLLRICAPRCYPSLGCFIWFYFEDRNFISRSKIDRLIYTKSFNLLSWFHVYLDVQEWWFSMILFFVCRMKNWLRSDNAERMWSSLFWSVVESNFDILAWKLKHCQSAKAKI